MGVSYKDKNFVHPQTLQAFVKEQIENGAEFPTELFKVYPLRSTKVK
jgi:ferritin